MTNPAQDAPKPLTKAEQDAAAARAADVYIEVFSEQSKFRPFPRTHKQLTVSDFQNMPTELNIFFPGMLSLFTSERYDLIDHVKPDAMSRLDFFHVIAREAQRRDLLGLALNSTSYVLRDDITKTMIATRPSDAIVPAENKATANISILNLAFRDVFTQMLANPTQKNGVYEADVAKQTGSFAKIDLSNDMTAMLVGYFAGANPAFNSAAGANGPVGALPLSVFFEQPTASEQQQAYCAAANEAAKPGRARGLDQNMAVSTGFLMAREDAKEAFASTAQDISLRGEVCPASPLPWNAAIMGKALTGEDKVVYDARKSATR